MSIFSAIFGSPKRVFISFDYDHDRNYRYLLTALARNSRSEIEFDDLTPGEIQSNNIGRIKAVLTSKIRAATHTLVVVGAHANTRHRDALKIGTLNWQWWEVEKSVAESKRLIGVKISRSNRGPAPLYNQGAVWAHSFTTTAILKAIDEA